MIFFFHSLAAQMSDPGEIGGFEYTLSPGLGEADISSYTVSLRGVKPLKQSFLGFGISYTRHEFSFFSTSLAANTASFEEIHTLRPNFFFVQGLKKNWSLRTAFRPLLSSNFKGGISEDDLLLNASISAIKRWQRSGSQTTLTLGVAYATFFGRPQIFPTLSFSRDFNNSWSYVIGIPRSAIRYQFKDRHSVSLKVGANGLYANNDNSFSLDGITTISNTKLVYNVLDLGFEYRYRIQPSITTVARVGYFALARLEIQDREQEVLYDFKADNAPYFTLGLNFNLNLKRNDIKLGTSKKNNL